MFSSNNRKSDKNKNDFKEKVNSFTNSLRRLSTGDYKSKNNFFNFKLFSIQRNN